VAHFSVKKPAQFWVKINSKGAKPLTATTRTTPRESGADTEDNRPDPSNFGRDTFPGFDA